MKKQIYAFILMAGLAGFGSVTLLAHPASGIVVDQEGRVFFVHTGHGVCTFDAQGHVSYIHRARDGHWLCLDPQGSFANSQPKYFRRITPLGTKPAIIFAGGGSPIAVLPDGLLYYVSGDTSLEPGGLRLARNAPNAEPEAFAVGVNATTAHAPITGLAAGPDGALYVACPSAVFKVKKDRTFTTLIDPIRLEGCDVDYADGNTNNPLPYLRGLAVDKHGTVFAAGTACHCVVKISADGKAEPVLKVERPWSPTGVAVHGEDVYVLEYSHANEARAQGWVPRVRKLEPDGKVTTLVTVEAER